MKYLKKFNQINEVCIENSIKKNEGFKSIIAGILLFFSSCTNLTVKNKSGIEISKPVGTTIEGVVTKQIFFTK